MYFVDNKTRSGSRADFAIGHEWHRDWSRAAIRLTRTEYHPIAVAGNRRQRHSVDSHQKPVS